MTRRCSHCGNNGHNSRTCPNRGVKIFGVRFDGGGSIRKSQSMGNLSHYAGGSGGGSPAMGDGGDEREKDGYASEDFVKGSSSSCRERKKGVAWTEKEHKMFLLGLQKLGKGDWRGISRKFVVSRTPTQVASHAQKYFVRQTIANRRKRRISLFDMAPDELGDGSHEPEPVQAPPSLEAEQESIDANASDLVALPPPPPPPPPPLAPPPPLPPGAIMQYPYPVMCPYTPFFPFSYPFWPCYRADAMPSNSQSVVKPTAQHSTSSCINVDQLVSMSKLSIGENNTSPIPPPLDLLGGSERHSAFHASNPNATRSKIDSGSSPIPAI